MLVYVGITLLHTIRCQWNKTSNDRNAYWEIPAYPVQRLAVFYYPWCGHDNIPATYGWNTSTLGLPDSLFYNKHLITSLCTTDWIFMLQYCEPTVWLEIWSSSHDPFIIRMKQCFNIVSTYYTYWIIYYNSDFMKYFSDT